MSVFTKKDTEQNLAIGKDCPQFEMCKELIIIETNQKFNKIKMILFTIFGFLGLIGINLLVFFLTELLQLKYGIIIFDVLAVGLMLGIPVKELIQNFFKIKNGDSIVINKSELESLTSIVKSLKELKK